LTVQYSGRQLSHSKVKVLNTELEAPGTTGKIQVGDVPGCIAQVIVPAFFGPVADASGTSPMAPGTVAVPDGTVVAPVEL
jgi:hypothetical protein